LRTATSLGNSHDHPNCHGDSHPNSDINAHSNRYPSSNANTHQHSDENCHTHSGTLAYPERCRITDRPPGGRYTASGY
jgi:hypothetical protein